MPTERSSPRRTAFRSIPAAAASPYGPCSRPSSGGSRRTTPSCLNDPYVAGGNHLPDWVIARPVFADGTLVAFACNRAHQSDIGGGAAGTYNPQATEIFHEGIRLPPLKLVERGTTRDDLWQLLMINSRCPDLLDGDLRAMLGATRVGADELAQGGRRFRPGRNGRTVRRDPRSRRPAAARGDPRAARRRLSGGGTLRQRLLRGGQGRLVPDADQERRSHHRRFHRHRSADPRLQELVAGQHLFRRLCGHRVVLRQRPAAQRGNLPFGRHHRTARHRW